MTRWVSYNQEDHFLTTVDTLQVPVNYCAFFSANTHCGLVRRGEPGSPRVESMFGVAGGHVGPLFHEINCRHNKPLVMCPATFLL